MGTINLTQEYSPLEAAIILGIKDMRKIQLEISRYLLGSGRHNDRITGREIAKYIMDIQGLIHTTGSPRHPIRLLNGSNGDVEKYWRKANDNSVKSIDVPHIVMPLDKSDVTPEDFMGISELISHYYGYVTTKVPALKEKLTKALDRIVFETRLEGKELVYRQSETEERYPVIRFYVANGRIYYNIKDVTSMVVRCRIFGEDYPYKMLTASGNNGADTSQYLDAQEFARRVGVCNTTVTRYIKEHGKEFPDQPIAIRKNGSTRLWYNASPDNIAYFSNLKKQNIAKKEIAKKAFNIRGRR